MLSYVVLVHATRILPMKINITEINNSKISALHQTSKTWRSITLIYYCHPLFTAYNETSKLSIVTEDTAVTGSATITKTPSKKIK